MGAVNWLFDSGQATVRRWEAIRWWELRRVPYNVIVAAVGGASVVLMEVAASAWVPPGEDFVEPLALLLGILLFGIVANVGYTLGWIVEICVVGDDRGKHQAFRARNFRRGLAWSCVLASGPIWISMLSWVVHKVAG